MNTPREPAEQRNGKVYDGSFSGTIIEGNGILADILGKNGIEVFGESQLNYLLELDLNKD